VPFSEIRIAVFLEEAGGRVVDHRGPPVRRRGPFVCSQATRSVRVATVVVHC
jgi:hypothetical protein